MGALPHLSSRAAFDGRHLLWALILSLVLHGLLIVGTPRLGQLEFKPPVEPPLEVDLIAAPPPAAVEPPRPAPPPRPARTRAKPPRSVTPSDIPPRVAAAPAHATVAQAEKPGSVSRSVTSEQAAPAVEAVEAVEAAAPEPAAYPLRSASLVFDLYYGDSQTLVGEVVQTFELQDDRYVATASAEAVGFVGLFLGGRYEQRSEGRLGPQGLVPERYTVKERRGREIEQATFDWSASRLRFERKGRVREAPLNTGAQDPLSAVHQLHYLRPLQPGLLMDVVTTRKVEQMLFMHMGHEEVQTALGSVVATHVKRQDLDGEVTEVWLDPSRYFMPVRVYNRNRNGYVLVQVLREARFVRTDDASIGP